MTITSFRLVKLCQDLGQQSGSVKHSAAAGSIFPLPNDIAKSGWYLLPIAGLFYSLCRSRSELELHKSKQAALQADLRNQSKGTITSSSSKSGTGKQHSSSHESVGELCLRRLWCDQAKILTEQVTGLNLSAAR